MEAVWTIVCDQDHTWSWKPGQCETSPVLLCIKAIVIMEWSGTGPQSQGEGWSSHAASMAGAKKVSIVATTIKAKTLSVSELFSSLLGWPTHQRLPSSPIARLLGCCRVLFICVCVCTHIHIRTLLCSARVWRSEACFVKSVLFSSLYVGSGDWIQVTGQAQPVLYLWLYLAGPSS